MLRAVSLWVVAAFLVPVSTTMADWPAEIRKHFNDHVVGEWTTETTWGDQRMPGQNSVSWNIGAASVTASGTMTDAKGVIHSTELMGWDEASSSIVVQGFDSRGVTWTIRWKRPTSGNLAEWSGVGIGTVGGKKWDSPTTIRYSKDGFRYEDTTDGKPFISVGTRKVPTASPVHEHLKSLQPLVGDFQIEGTWADRMPINGEEHTAWILDKSFLLAHGWFKNREGKRVDYCYLQGWNSHAKTTEMFIVDSNGWHARRVGKVDPSTQRFSGRQEGHTGDGEPYSYDVEVQFGDQKNDWRGTHINVGKENLPDLKMTFRRQ